MNEGWKKSKFARGWTRYNCLNKGYVVPDWAREPDETPTHKRWIDEHNRKVRERGERTTER